jgi:organic radical activating enzyme
MNILPDNWRTLLHEGKWLPLMEDFYTIQGEGRNTGKAAYFIRLGGCDVGCHWCDVKESWNPDLHPLTDIEEIVARATAVPAKAVVVTGGEPTTYNLTPLTNKLKQNGIKTFIESSGAYPLTGQWDWICFSPKKTAPPHPAIFEQANELKIIVYNANDFKFAEQYAQKVNKQAYLYLQPEWSKREKITPLIIDYVKQHPQWNISLQTHKYLNIP